MPRVWWVLLSAITAFGQSNPELLKIFNDDQKDRENGVSMTKAQLDAIAGNDGARRKLVREMLQAGDVKTAEDHDRAAFLFQHGSEPSDCLLAPESMEVVQGVLDLRAKEDDFVAALRVNGRKTVLEDMSIGTGN
jgi:hypothetical protein